MTSAHKKKESSFPPHIAICDLNQGFVSLGAVLGRSPGWLSPSVRVHLLRDLGVSNWAYVSCECLVINYRVRKPRVVTDPRLASRRGIACERAGVTLSWP